MVYITILRCLEMKIYYKSVTATGEPKPCSYSNIAAATLDQALKKKYFGNFLTLFGKETIA